MKRMMLFAGILLLAASTAMATNHEIKPVMPNLSGIGIGKRLYDQNCASCHGLSMRGTKKGPPFLHRAFHPKQVSDGAFHAAVRRGVRQKRWNFGNMAAIKRLRRGMVSSIIQYVRFMQKQAGIL